MGAGGKFHASGYYDRFAEGLRPSIPAQRVDYPGMLLDAQSHPRTHSNAEPILGSGMQHWLSLSFFFPQRNFRCRLLTSGWIWGGNEILRTSPKFMLRIGRMIANCFGDSHSAKKLTGPDHFGQIHIGVTR